MGLFGLASFMVIQRTKEVVIRKILGATVTNVIVLPSRDFIVLIIFSFAIATSISAYIMNDWLLRFAYRIDIPRWTFLSGILTAAVALLTVSFQALKAAFADPVKAIKAE
jgi:putative ABC transport system permease protein